ncbi:MAG: GTP-binding protein [Candidatus Omnitrophica bacterium]|nr:GTP-binding protein [Candidatus Omnitrophota bacterium]MBU0896035.1 GTP-binding protein [Candidatus Omnitrophota bacterium]MBU1133350.1 GTP-binding protein [Candidatus Omnitrophota bacterium]MBU1811125.1 GTP-binding protein [Candidatus Omnitrophota bacterium]
MPNQKRRKDVRNIAIVAHVDYGKTTLVDALLKYTGAYKFDEGETAIMDSTPLEKERGITIFSKNASFNYKGVQCNIVDTPGHTDFGSEVERILEMVDGVLLLVDAVDGPMPQTKFVLKKSLELHLKSILVINVRRDGTTTTAKVTKIMKYKGLAPVGVTEAMAGDIVMITGIEGVAIGETLADVNNPKALPAIKIDEPTMSMIFSHNTSPLAGKDGGVFLTSRHIREYLEHEAMVNVGIKVEEIDKGERFKVSGRGELHLEVLRRKKSSPMYAL